MAPFYGAGQGRGTTLDPTRRQWLPHGLSVARSV